MSKWECNSGHILEGLFYNDNSKGGTSSMPGKLNCPYCGSEMVLTNAEGAAWLLQRIRDFVRKVVEDPEYKQHGPRVLADLGQLETTIRKMSEEALRP